MGETVGVRSEFSMVGFDTGQGNVKKLRSDKVLNKHKVTLVTLRSKEEFKQMRGCLSNPEMINEGHRLELPRAWEPAGSSRPSGDAEGGRASYSLLVRNKA
jgi:hypothetical protein